MAGCTLEQLVPDGDYLYHAPFVIANHKVKDIGLVGWNNTRWSHQDKAQRNTAQKSSGPQGMLAQTPESWTAWKQAFDPESCRYYFYNEGKGTTSWEAPNAPFTPDETVEYYVLNGIADPWAPPRSAHMIVESAVQASAWSSAAVHSAPPESGARCPNGSLLDDLIPAHVRFSPFKKGDLAKDVERYWVLRYSLFSRWSAGVVLNETSLFSVTPEIIAKHHARMLRGGTSVLDAFCGCGGNTIHLGMEFKKVIACEIDKDQIAMARRNCDVYAVAARVTWIHGDVFKSDQIDPVDVVFLSPPWGGPGAHTDAMFDATMPVSGLDRYETYHFSTIPHGLTDTPEPFVLVSYRLTVTQKAHAGV